MDFILFAAEPKPPLTWELRIPLSVMNFLEFAIWGSWFVVLGNYLNNLKFPRKNIGQIYATMALGSTLSTLFIAPLADRYFAADKLFAVLHLIGGVLLFLMAYTKTPRSFYWFALLYALVYAPTLALVNSIVFAHIPDPSRDFPTIRVLGTIGWIAAGMSLWFLIKPGQPVNNRPLLLAGVLSIILGVFSFFLPATNPPAEASAFLPNLSYEELSKAFPVLDALSLFNEPSFALFFGVSFFITLALAFYFSWTAIFLEEQSGVAPKNVGPLMTIGQWMEIIFMLLLPWFLANLGMKWVLVLGMAAWGLRYAIFASQSILPVLLVGVALHGICFDFFFAAGFIHVENTAPVSLRNSGQALFAFLTYGLGMYLGTEFSGRLNQWFTTETTDPETGETKRITDWRKFWLVPCVAVVVALIPFILFFEIPS